jgi:hypothetical protein
MPAKKTKKLAPFLLHKPPGTQPPLSLSRPYGISRSLLAGGGAKQRAPAGRVKKRF